MHLTQDTKFPAVLQHEGSSLWVSVSGIEHYFEKTKDVKVMYYDSSLTDLQRWRNMKFNYLNQPGTAYKRGSRLRYEAMQVQYWTLLHNRLDQYGILLINYK